MATVFAMPLNVGFWEASTITPSTMKVSLIASSKYDLLDKLHKIDVTVPGRTKGRRSFHCENWSLCHFLSSFADDPILQYPIRIEGQDREGRDRESPDFLLSMSGIQIGLEVTQATHQDYAWAMALTEKEPRTALELSRFRPGHKIEKGSGQKPPVNSLDRPFIEPGWVGNAVEIEWTAYMLEAISNKCKRLNALSFQRFDGDWLLIYDNTPTTCILHIDEAAMLLAAEIKDSWEDHFCHIFIQTGNTFVHLNSLTWRRLPENDLWLNRIINSP